MYAVFKKSVNLLCQELSFNKVFKKSLIPTDLHTIRKKAGSVLVSVYLSCSAENIKVTLQCVRDLDLPKYNTLQLFE